MAVALEEEGFEVFLDVLQEIPPTNWAVHIEQVLSRADVVLCVCTPTYAERVDGEVPGGVGRGVAQEGALARGETYDQKMQADRFRVIQLDGSPLDVPKFLQGLGSHAFRWI